MIAKWHTPSKGKKLEKLFEASHFLKQPWKKITMYLLIWFIIVAGPYHNHLEILSKILTIFVCQILLLCIKFGKTHQSVVAKKSQFLWQIFIRVVQNFKYEKFICDQADSYSLRKKCWKMRKLSKLGHV